VSWRDGAAKHAIFDIVDRVTAEGGRDFIPAADRIATFDNDEHCGPSKFLINRF
jgi:hypothetical protein